MSQDNEELTQAEVNRVVAAARILHNESHDIAVYEDAEVVRVEAVRGLTAGYWVTAKIWINVDVIEKVLKGKYKPADWQYEVANGDTVLGYADWIAHKISRDGQ